MNKKKAILAAVAVSSLIAIGVIHNNKDGLVINDIKVKDISKIKDEDLTNVTRQITISDKEGIKDYNKLELVSFSSTLDKESSSYVINMNFKNISEDIIKDLDMDFVLYGIEGDISVKKTNKKELKPNEEFAISFDITAKNILDTCIKEGEPKNTDNFKEVFEIHTKNNNLRLRYNYTYVNEIDNNLSIVNNLDFNGDITETSVNIIAKPEEIITPKTHIDCGIYLNLVKPEDTNVFNSIETMNVTLGIDEDFNFEVTGHFKNVGYNDIDSFVLQPRLTLFNSPISYDFAVTEQDKNIIKPGEDFKVTTLIKKEDIVFSNEIYEKINNVNSLKNKNDINLLKELIKKRFISLGYSYHYTIGDVTTSVHTTYTNTAKLLEMNLFEYETIIDDIDESM